MDGAIFGAAVRELRKQARIHAETGKVRLKVKTKQSNVVWGAVIRDRDPWWGWEAWGSRSLKGGSPTVHKIFPVGHMIRQQHISVILNSRHRGIISLSDRSNENYTRQIILKRKSTAWNIWATFFGTTHCAHSCISRKALLSPEPSSSKNLSVQGTGLLWRYGEMLPQSVSTSQASGNHILL